MVLELVSGNTNAILWTSWNKDWIKKAMIKEETKGITVIGGGLAGCEAAWQAVKQGIPVRLLEMKPLRFSPAHISPLLAELVCSNSFRSQDLESAVGLLKEEMRQLGSLVMEAALIHRVPAGKALAVDREGFAKEITAKIEAHPLIEVINRDVSILPETGPLILATGPLTTDELARDLGQLVGSNHLHFYDAIAPIVYLESIDFNRAYLGSRYGHGGADYINCPMDEGEYAVFLEQMLQAEQVPLHSFEDVRYFEGCLPVEIMAQRGKDTLRFGPDETGGIARSKDGEIPYAVVQLRQDNQEGTLYNMVGFQTKLKWPEQERVFRLIPGLEKAEFARLGSIHRNTFVNGPEVLLPTLQLKKGPSHYPGRSDYRGGRLCGIGSHGDFGRDQWHPLSSEQAAGDPTGHDGPGGLGGPCKSKTEKRFSAHECHLRPFSIFAEEGPPPPSWGRPMPKGPPLI